MPRLHAPRRHYCDACKLPHAESGCCHRRCPAAASQQLQMAGHGINGALGGGPNSQHCAAAGRNLCAACRDGSGRGAPLQLQVHAACSNRRVLRPTEGAACLPA